MQTAALLAEIIGAIAVVVSLIYLAVQVRQNSVLLKTDSYGRALDWLSEFQFSLGEDDALNRIFSRGIIDIESLKPRERTRMAWALYHAFGSFEFLFHSSRSGGLPDGIWERWDGTVDWWLSYPGVRTWWHARPAPFSPQFPRNLRV